MTTFIASYWTGNTTTQDADVLSIVNSKGACEVAATIKIDRSIRRNLDSLFRVQARGIITEITALRLGSFLGIFFADCRLRCKHQQVICNIPVELYADVLRLEQQELHHRVILNVGYRAAIIWTNTSRLILFILTHHAHKNITREVEHTVADLCSTMRSVGLRGINLGHICINLCPLLLAAWLDKDVVVVLQWSTLRGCIRINAMQLGTLFHSRCHKHVCL